MLKWFGRGVSRGVMTTPFPFGPPEGAQGTHSAVEIRRPVSREEAATLRAVCPTDVFDTADGHLLVRHTRCILCGLCVEACPEVVSWTSDVRVASLAKDDLTDRIQLLDAPGKEGER